MFVPLFPFSVPIQPGSNTNHQFAPSRGANTNHQFALKRGANTNHQFALKRRGNPTHSGAFQPWGRVRWGGAATAGGDNVPPSGGVPRGVSPLGDSLVTFSSGRKSPGCRAERLHTGECRGAPLA